MFYRFWTRIRALTRLDQPPADSPRGPSLATGSSYFDQGPLISLLEHLTSITRIFYTSNKSRNILRVSLLLKSNIYDIHIYAYFFLLYIYLNFVN